ncbi:MAG TPA: Gldg family protein [Stellaceae bacterium]|nr:Gldg family protein [Stellaceae bacterium]
MALWFRRAGIFASRRARSLTALVCLGLMLIAVNIIAGRFLTARLDLTSERLYTLSHGTRQTLAHIDEPITLRFYYSTRLGELVPGYGVYAQRVRELLDEYVAAAKGKLRLEVYNPQAFSDTEDRAVAFGLQSVPLDVQGEQVFFGLAGTNSTDDQQVIAFFAPERERLLEYDLTRLVHSLAVPKRTTVGLVSTLPLEGEMIAMRGRASRPMAIIEQLRQLDKVETLGLEIDAVPADIDVLMLVHPQNLSPKTLFAIDQFVLKGGKALVFVDPYSELQAGQRARPGAPADSNLEPLFKAWGLQLLPNTVAGDRREARRVAVQVTGRGQQAIDYVAWLNLRDGDINHDDVITAELRQLAMASAGILEPLEGATTKLEPLITTSPEAMKIPVDKVAPMPDVPALLIGFKSEDTRYTLAARVTGPVATAFPDGPPKPAATPAKPDEPAKPEQPPPPTDFLRQSAQPINVIVVADTDMLDDKFWAQSQDFFGRRIIVPTANNGDFVANAVEVLAGGEDLVDLRSRGSSARHFLLVEQIQRVADDRYAAEQQALQEKLKQTQQKLRELTGSNPATPAAPLSPEQARAIEQFRADMVATRQQLRAVQGALRQDIEGLKAILEFCDIALVPILVAVAAIVLGALRLRRRRHRRPAPA